MQKLVFVVDDNRTDLTMAERALEKQYRVITLPSAAKLFDMLKKLTPDLILLDIEMPETSGFEALKQLKADDLYSFIPVIIVTTEGTFDYVKAAIALGACNFVVKPYQKDTLIAKIAEYIL